jgi:hypothetical protein
MERFMSEAEDFEALFSEIAGDEIQVAPEVKAVIDTPVPVVIDKAVGRYKTDTGKVLVEGGPTETMIYSAGYCRFKWPNQRFANQAVLYADQVDELAEFFQSEGYKAWRASADKAGLRKRGEARKES